MIIALDSLPKEFHFLINHLYKTQTAGLDAWIGISQQPLIAENAMLSAVLADLTEKTYGKETARKFHARHFPIPWDERGKPFAPADTDLKDFHFPFLVDHSLYLRISHGIRRIDLHRGFQGDIHFDFILPHELFQIAYCHPHFLLAHKNTLYLSNDHKNFEPLHTFQHNILKLGPTLHSHEATILLTEASLPTIAPLTFLFQNDRKAILPLPNIQQNLQNDCVASRHCFVCCGGGMQSKEVRFIYADGSWRTKFIHDEAPLAIANAPQGPVSVAATGEAFLWEDERILADRVFDVAALPPYWAQQLAQGQLIADWDTPNLTLLTTQTGHHTAPVHPYVQALLPLNATHRLAILKDRAYYLWDHRHQTVAFHWQLSACCASQQDWLDILRDSPLSIEEDPRIRQIGY